MRPTPPPQIVTLLKMLGLPAAERIDRVAGRVARRGKDLPVFESVWIDALMQARYLTPFQAAEIRDGRGRSLRRGNYLLEAELATDGLVRWFRARSIARRRTVRLATFTVEADRADTVAADLKTLIAALGSIDPQPASRPIAFGVERAVADNGDERSEEETVGDRERRIWLAENYRQGTTARRWLTLCGRFPVETVVAIARVSAERLATLHRADVIHGDLSAGNLLLTSRGGVLLIAPGLRPIIRPQEGFAHDDLPPCCYDYLAPEQIGEGTPASQSTDIFALGCLWWHLLCGRPPRIGGTAEDKIRAVRYDEVPDPRRQVPQVPDSLRDAIRQATDPDPERRPKSAELLLDWLGPSTRRDRRLIARAVRRPRPNLTDGWTSQRAGDDITTVPPTPTHSPLRAVLGLSILLTVVALATINFAAPETFRLAGTLLDRFTATADPQPVEPPPAEPGKLDPQIVKPTQPVVPLETPPVIPAVAQTPIIEPTNDLVLDAQEPIAAERLELRPGRTVRGPIGGRATLIVPPNGFTVDVPDVRFEGIDFIASNDAAADTIINLAADQARFTGCTFRASPTAAYPPVAIRWSDAASDVVKSLPSGSLTMIDCRFEQTASAVELGAPGDRGLHFRQTVHAGFGPLIHISRPPSTESMISLHLTDTRLEGSGPLLQIRTDAQSPGRILIHTEGCRLACRTDVALLEMTGTADPMPLLGRLRWIGRETTIPLGATVARWQNQPLDDSTISIEGVVRSDENRVLGSEEIRE